MNRREFVRSALTTAGSSALGRSDLAAVSLGIWPSPIPRIVRRRTSSTQVSIPTCSYANTPSGPLSSIDPLYVYSVSQGALFASTDVGASWKAILVPKNCYLLTATIVSRVVGWAAGSNGTLFNTKDGGISWTERRIDKDYCLGRMSFASEKMGYVAGEQGAIYRTEDGKRWIRCECPAVGDFEDLRCWGEIDAWAVAGGLLLHTSNQGNTWNVIPTPTKAFAVSPVDLNNLFVSCGNGQLYSSDQGRTWVEIGSPSPGGPQYFVNPQFFVSANVGWVAAYGPGYGIVYCTRDRGKTWVKSLPGTNGISGLIATSENDLWVAGGNPAATTDLVHSKDGGISWDRHTTLPVIPRTPWQIYESQHKRKI